jgi:hypothetical protein
MGQMKNAFTVDVEDYFQVEGFAGAIDRESWGSFRTRVGQSTSTLLEMLARHGVRATFFVLGSHASTRRSCAALSTRVTKSPRTA